MRNISKVEEKQKFWCREYMAMEPRTNSVSNLSDDIKIQLFNLLSWGNVECLGLQLLHMNRT